MAYTEFYCNASTGDNTYAGDNAANGVVTATNGGINTGTRTFTAASGTPFSGVVANTDYVAIMADGATVTPFIALVTSVGGGGSSLVYSATVLSGTPPGTAATGITAKTGGKWRGPNAAIPFPFGVAGAVLARTASTPVRVNFENTATYSVSTTSGATAITANVAGPITWEGCTSTPGDGGTALIDGTGGGAGVVFQLFNPTATAQAFKYLRFNGNFAGTPAGGNPNGDNMVNLQATNSLWYRCIFSGAWRFGFQGQGTGNAGGSTMIECLAYNNNADNDSTSANFGATEEMTFIRCVAVKTATKAQTAGFYLNGSAGEPITLINCISAENGQHGYRIAGATPVKIIGCTSANNGGAGLFTTTTSVGGLDILNCLFSDNAGWGIQANVAVNGASIMISGNAFYSNGLGEITNINTSFISGSITLNGDPFDGASNGDFELNNNLNAGQDCRNTGVGSFLFTGSGFSSTTVSYPDIGAAQHDETPFIAPDPYDVRLGVDNGNGQPGTLTSPSQNDVEAGVQYGGDGTQYTGNLTLPSVDDVLDGIQFGANGTQFEGTLQCGGGDCLPACECVKALPVAQKLDAIYCAIISQ